MAPIKTRQAYKILGFNDNCPRNYMQKLLSLGFIPGETFYIAKKALFGNPYHIMIKNFSVSLRKSEILYMQVTSL